MMGGHACTQPSAGGALVWPTQLYIGTILSLFPRRPDADESAAQSHLPSNATGGDENKRQAFELTRQAIGYRMLQLLALPLDTMDNASLQAALLDISRR